MFSPISCRSDRRGQPMNRYLNSGTASVVGALALVLTGITSLQAGGLSVPPVRQATVQKECSACHMLYPPALLPARSWRQMLGTLGEHFGENAELDEATARTIADYLASNAGDTRKGASKVLRGLEATATPARITELPWWRRKHEKKDRVAPATLAKKGAKFKGDCKACHKEAEKGYFDEE